MERNNKNKGFTILEVVLVIAIIGILSGLSIPVYSKVMERNDLDLALKFAREGIWRAEALSRAMAGDSEWGVNIEDGEVTVFRGDSFSTRDEDYDEVILFTSNAEIEGDTEIVFEKMTGFVDTEKEIEFSLGDETKSIIINTKGVIIN